MPGTLNDISSSLQVSVPTAGQLRATKLVRTREALREAVAGGNLGWLGRLLNLGW